MQAREFPLLLPRPPTCNQSTNQSRLVAPHRSGPELHSILATRVHPASREINPRQVSDRARPIHQLMVLDPPTWVFENINKWMRSFFWARKDKISGGQCLVAWDTICRPTCFGGLSVKDTSLQVITLRVRWEWLRRSDPERPWQGLQMMVDEQARGVFDSLVKIMLEICPRGNNKMVIIIFPVHDKCLLFMRELY
jgi:hypothetical protein